MVVRRIPCHLAGKCTAKHHAISLPYGSTCKHVVINGFSVPCFGLHGIPVYIACDYSCALHVTVHNATQLHQISIKLISSCDACNVISYNMCKCGTGYTVACPRNAVCQTVAADEQMRHRVVKKVHTIRQNGVTKQQHW